MNPTIAETDYTAEAASPAHGDHSADRLVLPVVNTAQLGCTLPDPVCIARSLPRTLDIPHLKILAPSWELLKRWRDSKGSDECWSDYVRSYWSEIATRCKRDRKIWQGANQLLEHRLHADMRGACIAYVLQSAADRMGVNKLTLCCYERPEDQWCHRKLIYDALPKQMKGGRD